MMTNEWVKAVHAVTSVAHALFIDRQEAERRLEEALRNEEIDFTPRGAETLSARVGCAGVLVA